MPCSTPVRHIKQDKKKLRTYPSFLANTPEVTRIEAEKRENLVPIRLDMELDGRKLRDVFTWNRNETSITPEMFAEMLCDDLELNPQMFVSQISAQIRGQINQNLKIQDDVRREILKKAENMHYPENTMNLPEYRTTPVEEIHTEICHTKTSHTDHKQHSSRKRAYPKEQRVIIKLNVQVGNTNLIDQFEWDLTDENNSPEEFSKTLCRELGLAGEFYSAIAYSIRGQLAWHRQSSTQALPPIRHNLLRVGMDAEPWGPSVETLSDKEMTKRRRDEDRNTRRMQRL